MHQDVIRLLTEARAETLSFQQVIDTLHRHYECSPAGFTTGANTPSPVYNPPGTNAASGQLLAFARRLGLDTETILAMYAEHYRAVQADPQGSGHANIRALMAGGLDGVRWESDPLRLRGPG